MILNLSEYQKDRIRVFLNPELDPLRSGYQVIQSKLAVGSGEIAGSGLLQGVQTQLGYLPAKHTDFIFSVLEIDMEEDIFIPLKALNELRRQAFETLEQQLKDSVGRIRKERCYAVL